MTGGSLRAAQTLLCVQRRDAAMPVAFGSLAVTVGVGDPALSSPPRLGIPDALAPPASTTSSRSSPLSFAPHLVAVS